MNENMPRSGDVSQSTSSVKNTLKEKASGLADEAKQQAREQYAEKKEVARGELDTLAMALRRAGNEVSDSGGMSGRVISTVADRIESLSRSIEGKNLDEVVDSVERFARSNTAAFLGGAVAVGFLASRFLKSSTPRSFDDRDFYSSEAYGGYARNRVDSAIGSTGYGTTYGSELDRGSDFSTQRTGSTVGSRSAGSGVTSPVTQASGTSVTGTVGSGSDFGVGSDSDKRGGTGRR